MARAAAWLAFSGSLLLAMPGSLAAQQRCKGTKRWYAGQCRYPEEIERLQAQQAEAQQRAAEERRRAAEQARQREKEQRELDQAGCAEARQAGSAAAWQQYLEAFPDGGCQKEAEQSLTALREEPARPKAAPAASAPPSPPPPPARAPAPAPAPVQTQAAVAPTPLAPPGQPEPRGALSPWVYVGFGVGGAGLLSWAITGGISLSQSNALKDECGADGVCPPEREGDLDTATSLAHVATASFALGLVGTGVGVTALLLSGEDEDGSSSDPAPRSKPAVVLQPVVTLAAVGVKGRF